MSQFKELILTFSLLVFFTSIAFIFIGNAFGLIAVAVSFVVMLVMTTIVDPIYNIKYKLIKEDGVYNVYCLTNGPFFIPMYMPIEQESIYDHNGFGMGDWYNMPKIYFHRKKAREAVDKHKLKVIENRAEFFVREVEYKEKKVTEYIR